MVTGLIILGVVVVIGVIGFVLYNSLVSLRNKVQEGWAQIDVQLTRRADLIPNLISTVKGYASHESQVLRDVTEARSAVQGAGTPVEAAAANDGLSSALGRLFAVSEGYPDLKASTNFLQLQEELTATENKVAYARQYYNNAVNEMNTKIETVPTNIIAKFGSFPRAEYFTAPNETVRAVPKVEF
jgi:LemA protein